MKNAKPQNTSNGLRLVILLVIQQVTDSIFLDPTRMADLNVTTCVEDIMLSFSRH